MRVSSEHNAFSFRSERRFIDQVPAAAAHRDDVFVEGTERQLKEIIPCAGDQCPAKSIVESIVQAWPAMGDLFRMICLDIPGSGGDAIAWFYPVKDVCAHRMKMATIVKQDLVFSDNVASVNIEAFGFPTDIVINDLLICDHIDIR